MKKHILLAALLSAALSQAQAQAPRWPELTQQHKPWTRWWWQGSAVNPQDLTRLMTQYQQAGLGGLEITAIYGVKGAENQFIDFLSPKWMDMLAHTLTEGQRLGLGIDVAQASGWPFGGPWVSPADACKYVAYQTYTVPGGQQLTEPVQYVQKPLLRTVGQPIDLKQLADPITKNPNLQLHAFDQVRFEKPLPLQTLMAYSDKGQTLDLTGKVAVDGKLNWTAPAGSTWTLYGVFQGWHGKMVERAGPGGEGDVIDHFSKQATDNYLRRFDEAFKGRDVKPIRAFFNDSYEVDDAQGEGNWTPQLFAEFQRRRGYDLKQHLPALFGKAATDENQRVLSDYRETISELLLENYTRTWSEWAKKHDALIRNQAHGSPANILDLYAVTDIPETEGEDLLRIKFASSAAHVTGKPLTSAESATWENDHFLSKLSDVKKAMDRMLLGGVNHTFYHGTNYSPQQAAWPGWLFYAAVHFNPNNSFWQDFGQLNRYVARCQSFLQAGKPSNDVLLYLPIYDSYTRPGKVLLQHYDGIDHGFKGMTVGATGRTLLERGYGFDFISDKQLLQVKGAGKALQTGGAAYQTVVVPNAQVMPLATLEQLLKLAQGGATIIFQNQLPTDVNGLGNLGARRAAFKKLLGQVKLGAAQGEVQKASVGKGTVLVGTDVDQLLAAANVKRENMVDSGLEFVRRRHAKGHYYYLANWGDKPVEGWVPLQTAAKAVALYNPMTEKLGMAAVRTAANGRPEVYLQLAPGESCVLETNEAAVSGPAYAYAKPAGAAQAISGTWDISFVAGGPELPAKVQRQQLASWTTFGGEAGQKFSGTAAYTISFAQPQAPAAADGWLLDLGRVGESARVQLNGQELGTLIGPTYQVFIPKDQLKATNTLTVNVSNGMANRIIDMDRRGAEYRQFYNINMSAKLKENRNDKGLFTSAKWEPKESGLLGPVTLTPTSTHPDKLQ
ncbi:glycosyl hydrolase [Solirubrum puertoriconensis]|uniref:Glycoside hydrolase family 2 protein n=1 Tax=Solirubrum puertoriconensis TaxID=1751427 RepID=A0A9X0HNB5_SOLP1|nr:glycosyl hydrolase [Solirubrum puertoriconensis]KUG09151.1 glycoside hydrolase family 2 protein [Solirubrum puertoriconensis]